MAKTFKNLLLQNPKSFDFETWHAVLEPQARKIYINDAPVKFGVYTFEWGTSSSTILKQGMNHQGVMVYKVYINDPGLTVTYFKARSSLVKFAYCAYTRPIVR